MQTHKIFTMKFSNIYQLYLNKAERKNRTKEEVDQIICWLTGYDHAGLQEQVKSENDFETFFAQAPALTPKSSLIKGVVCGIRVEEIEDGNAEQSGKEIGKVGGKFLSGVLPCNISEGHGCHPRVPTSRP